jgi:hypothetical protein
MSRLRMVRQKQRDIELKQCPSLALGAPSVHPKTASGDRTYFLCVDSEHGQFILPPHEGNPFCRL